VHGHHPHEAPRFWALNRRHEHTSPPRLGGVAADSPALIMCMVFLFFLVGARS
jgi:hypothetical protein